MSYKIKSGEWWFISHYVTYGGWTKDRDQATIFLYREDAEMAAAGKAHVIASEKDGVEIVEEGNRP